MTNSLRPTLRSVFLASLFAGVALLPESVQAQASSGPVHFPDSTNAAATNAPSQKALPAWMQSPATPASPAPAAPALTPSASPSDSGDIHDIRGPISIPYEWMWLVKIATGLLIAASLYALWRFLPRRGVERIRPPYEIALEKLEAARALMKADTIREYAFTVSEIIRVYIEQRFNEVAARRTTEEFLSDLIHQAWSPLAAHRVRLEDFLSHCDLIKFARWGATARELELMQESARAFIVETQAEPVAPAPAAHQTNPPVPPFTGLAQVK